MSGFSKGQIKKGSPYLVHLPKFFRAINLAGEPQEEFTTSCTFYEPGLKKAAGWVCVSFFIRYWLTQAFLKIQSMSNEGILLKGSL